MAEKYKVRFLPGEADVEVAPGTTIMAAAIRAGVFVNGVCGGDGVCGRCRVILREGKAENGSTQFFTRDEIKAGYILACEGRVVSDVVVEVPEESRLHGKPVSPETQVPYLADISNLLRWKTRLKPLVRKTHVELPAPSLENNIADLQRLEQALGQYARRRAFPHLPARRPRAAGQHSATPTGTSPPPPPIACGPRKSSTSSRATRPAETSPSPPTSARPPSSATSWT